jgi:hypothetical protein
MFADAAHDKNAARDPLLGFLPRLYLPLLLLFIAAATWRPLTGAEDFWAHAAVGRWIWQHQTIPHHTLWLWSTPGVEWIAHSWLSQLVYFGVMRLGGACGVLTFTIILASLPFIWFWKLWAQRGKINAIAPVFFALAIWCASIRFQARPELFTAIFLSALLLLFSEMPRALSGKSARRNAILLVAMFALWANFHGAVAMGLLVLWLSIACEIAQQKFAQQKNARQDLETPLWKLIALGAACSLAIFVNPYGVHYWEALKPVGGAMFRLIDEWKSPLMAPALPPEAIGVVLLVALFALWCWAKNPARRWSQLAWIFLAAALFLSARRNLWPCILLSVAVASANAAALKNWRAPRFPRAQFLARGGAVAFLIAFSLMVFSPAVMAPRTGGEAGVLPLRATANSLPRGPANIVLQRHLPVPVFNDYLHSGYFHWRFGGAPPLYVDLLNAYEPQLLENYFEIIKRTPIGATEWEKLGVNTVVFGHYRKTDRLAPLAKYLDESPQWHKIYFSQDGAVWVRRAALKAKRANAERERRALP